MAGVADDGGPECCQALCTGVGSGGSGARTTGRPAVVTFGRDRSGPVWIVAAALLTVGAVVVAVVLVVAHSAGPRAPARGGSAVDGYQFSSGFSDVQGRGQWYYQQWDGHQYTDMSWDPAQHWWRGDCQYCIIARGWTHPDTNDAVIAWKAPRAGRVAILGDMDNQGYGQAGDGVRTVIRKKTGSTVEKIWPSGDYQEIRPGFAAQHVLTTDVRAGDLIYFQVDMASTTANDTLNWDPRIRYGFTPGFTLDQAELVMDPADFGRVGIASAQDSSLSVVPDGQGFDFYHSADQGRAIQKFRGTLDRPAGTPVYDDNRFTNPRGIPGKWWIENMYQTADGHLLAFCHIEGADVSTTGWWALGLAYSTDDGESFQILGTIVSQHVRDTGANRNIYGVPYVIRDGYFYVYYGEPRPAVARAPVAEVLDAANRGTVSPWRKYYRGAWNENALGGNASPVISGRPDGYAVHGDAAYSTYLGRYLLAGYGTGDNRGVFLTLSDDATCYEVPSWVQNAPGHDTLSPYETIVDVDGSDNGVVGRSFYLYFGYRFRVAGVSGAARADVWRWLYRVRVTLDRAGFDGRAAESCTAN
jgi:hypothetical protein